MHWYYAQQKQPVGPLSDEQISELFRSGQLAADSLIWREGMAGWQAARTMNPPPPGFPAGPPAAPDGFSMPNFTVEELLRASNAKAEPPPLKLAFTGTWRGYYRVWFVGMLLTLLTLGLFAPWAKVRNKRYLYAHTRLGEDGFDYRANPWRILMGNLVIAGLFALWLLSPLIHPLLPWALIGFGVLLLPWIITQSLRFNARATAWRGLRLRFRGNPFGFLMSHVLIPVFSFGILWPFATRSRRRWLVDNLSFGNTPFSYQTSVAELYGIYLKGLIFFVPAGLCYLGVAVRAYLEHASRTSADGFVAMPALFANIAVVGPEILPFTLPVALGGLDFIRARLFTHHWNGTTLGHHAFRAYMAPWDVFKMRMLHYAAMIVSFGLLWPWVKINNHTFMLECLDFAPQSDLADLTADAPGARHTGSIGDSAADFLDIEIGI